VLELNEVYIPDTSVIIDGRISDLIKKEKIKGKIIIPMAVVAELEYQANTGRETGFTGLKELQELIKLMENKKIALEFIGELPKIEDIELHRIDAVIREAARERKAILVTSDRVQSEVAKAMNVKVMFIEQEKLKKKPSFTKFFDQDTTSVHIKENCYVMAKRGKPGKAKLIKLSEKKLDYSEVERIANEIIEFTKRSREAFVEINRKGAMVIQYKNIRITIARPPFSDGLEITMVRPIMKTSLSDWNMSKKLLERLKEEAEGILIAGPPGHGKSTLASAIAEFYKEQGKIVKTMESPRDLQVSDDITQYTSLEGSFEKTADILLLVRPDYTVYDEVRKTNDFQIYADMRLAGVGMIGVVHASKAVDAIHRMIGRVELGLIPQVVDTVIFVRDAEVKKVYSLDFTVKVPTGMKDADLARPVVEIKDFENGELEYEIYTFGEQTVLSDVKKARASKGKRTGRIEKMLSKYFSGDIEVKRNKVIVHTTPKEVKGVSPKKLKRLEKKIRKQIEITFE